MGRGVAVAADDGLAGLGDAELRPDDVDDALRGLNGRRAEPEIGAVLLQRLDL